MCCFISNMFSIVIILFPLLALWLQYLNAWSICSIFSLYKTPYKLSLTFIISVYIDLHLTYTSYAFSHLSISKSNNPSKNAAYASDSRAVRFSVRVSHISYSFLLHYNALLSLALNRNLFRLGFFFFKSP